MPNLQVTTLPKTNIDPSNGPLGPSVCLYQPVVFRVYVSLRGGNMEVEHGPWANEFHLRTPYDVFVGVYYKE